MAVLYVTEFARIGRDAAGYSAPMAEQAPLAEQTVAIGAGSVQSSAFNSATRVVRLHADVICSIKFGTAPTATAATARMAAGTTEYFAVDASQQALAPFKVAVITNT
jgi:hypothetical protein